MTNSTKSQTEQQKRLCTQDACTVASDGRCYEGLPDPKSCSNYLGSDEDDLDDLDESEESSSPVETMESLSPPVDLYGGKELDYASSTRITAAAPTIIIVLAGPNDSGKTTLLVSIYEKFLRASFAGFIFAGSETLRAFELRCHLSRVESEGNDEDTERTKSFSEQTMLHLCVRDEQLNQHRQNLLLSDIRGEVFEAAIKSKAEAERIKIVKRADHLCLVMDGAKISELATRNQAAIDASQTLRSFLEAGMVGSDTYIDVVVTKDDLIQSTLNKNKTSEFLQTIESELRRKYENQVREIHFHKIAARPERGVDSYGVDKLFQDWLTHSRMTPSTGQRAPLQIHSDRKFDQFATIHLPHKFGRSEDQQ